TLNTSTLIKKAHQRLFFLRRLKKAHLSPLVNFYRCTIESILTNCILVWYGSCSVVDRKRVVKTAQRIMVPHSPPLRLSSARDVCGRRAASRRTAPIPPTDCFPLPLREALQGPPFPDQQAQEQLLPCGCHPVELCTTVIV